MKGFSNNSKGFPFYGIRPAHRGINLVQDSNDAVSNAHVNPYNWKAKADPECISSDILNKVNIVAMHEKNEWLIF